MNKIRNALNIIFKNRDSIFYMLLILIMNIITALSIFNKSSIVSVCFKSTFVIILIYFIFLFAQNVLKTRKISLLIKTNFFKYFLITLIVAICAGLVVLLPSIGKGNLSFDYFVKYACLVSTFAYVSILNCIKPRREVIRFSVYLSIAIGLLFCVATIIPSLRNKSYTGAFTYNFSNPNTAALFLCFVACNLIYGIFVVHSKFLKICLVIESIVMLVLIYLTQARAPLIAIIVGLIFSFIIFKIINKKEILVSSSLLLFILFFASVYVLIIYFVTNGKAAELVEFPSIGKGITSRYGMWTEAMKKIVEKPFEGFYSFFNGSLQYHNAVLDQFVSYGIPVAITIVSCFIYLLSKSFINFKFVSRSQYVAFFCLSACIFTGLFESSIFSSPQGLYILFFSFVIYINIPLTSDCLSENNAINFNAKTSNKIDVILINSVFKKGSTGKLADSLKQGIEKKGYVSAVLYGRKEIDKPVVNAAKCTSEFESIICRFINKITKDYSLFNYFCTYEYIRIIKKYKPQVIHVHCLNDHYINQYLLFKFLKRNHIKTILTLHSENLYVGCQEGHVFDCKDWCDGRQCLKCKKFKGEHRNKKTWKRLNKMFSNFKELQLTSVSPWLEERIKKSTICSKIRVNTILNGVDDAFRFTSEKSGLLSESISDKKKVLFVCANVSNPHKGFNYFERLASVFESNINIHFICVSLENYSNNSHLNVTFLSPIRDVSLLAKLYSECDISLVLSKKETFSMPTAESLCCGTKVAGFKCGGPESVFNNNAYFVEYGDVSRLEEIIVDVCSQRYSKNDISKDAIKIFSEQRMVESYLNIYNLNVGFSSKINI